YWLQFDTGIGFQDADSSGLPGGGIGTAFTPATSTFTEVADNLRHKVEVKLNAESYLQASAALGGTTGLSTRPVLDQVFNSVDLVGRPLTVGHLVTDNTIASLTFASRTVTYSPYLELGDEAFDSSHDQLFRGTDFQEVLTNFPLGNSLLTGLFLDVSLTAPGGAAQTFERALVDRIGYAVRNATASANMSFHPPRPPLLTVHTVRPL